MAGLRHLIVAIAAVMLSVLPFAVFAQSAVDQGQAYAECMSYKPANGSITGVTRRNCIHEPESGGRGRYTLLYWGLDSNGNEQGQYFGGYFQYEGLCSMRVDGQAGMINGTLYSGGVCDNGCKVQPNFDPGTDYSIRENGNSNAISVRAGTWKATGAVCTANDSPPRPEKKDEYCHQAAGYTVCKSKDKTCVSTASGFRTCASDTANEKGHTATNNPRTEAASISAPNTPPNPPTNRPGEDWKPSGPSTSVTNNNSGTTYNTQNYNNQGKPNGNQPTPGDGSGPGAGGSNGNGEQGEGNGNTASGGGTCTSPPATGGDPILGMIAVQTWATRCAAEKANGGKVTGDVGNCDAPFSVEGDTVQANQLRAQRAQLCAGRPGEGQGSGGDPHAGAEDVDGPGKWSLKFDADLIDTSGFGGGSCPTFGTLDFGKFGSVSLDSTTWWCQLVAAMRAVMLLMGAFISFRIVFGDS